VGARPVLILEDLLSSTTLDFALYSADLAAGYRLVSQPNVNLDGFLGLRLLHLKTGINTTVFGVDVSGDRKKSYYDPFLAVRLKYKPYHRLELMTYLDITPIPLENNYSFQNVSVISYFFNPHFFLAPGYRFVAHRKTDPDVTYFDGNIRGFYLRIGFQF